MSKITDIIGKVAPTVATLLGGPFAGIAAEAVGAAFGMKDATTKSISDLVSSGQMTGDQIAKLKEAELNLQVKLKELDLDAEKLVAQDTASARDMQTATHSLIPAFFGSVILGGYFFILIGLMTGDLKLWDNAGLQQLLGQLGSMSMAVVGFYFGAMYAAKVNKDSKA